MGWKVAKADAQIADIAGRQHGVVSVGQLRERGIGERAVQSRIEAGRLHRVHRGVFAVGHDALSHDGRSLAAVLAIGGGPAGQGGPVIDCWGAAVSHRNAASLWGLLPVAEGPVDVIVPGNGGRARRSGIRVHRSLSLVPTDVILRRRIPITTPARTIADLRKALSARGPRESRATGWGGGATIASHRELRKAIRQANVLGLPIGDESGGDRTRSDLERDFLWLCRRHRLPPPEVNVRIGPHLVDFLWRQRRFVVETDSYLYHRGRAAFQDDRGRNLELRRRGYEVLRLSEWQVNEEPDRVAETLSARLGRRSG